MARLPRIVVAKPPLHVIQRGNNCLLGCAARTAFWCAWRTQLDAQSRDIIAYPLAVVQFRARERAPAPDIMLRVRTPAVWKREALRYPEGS